MNQLGSFRYQVGRSEVLCTLGGDPPHWTCEGDLLDTLKEQMAEHLNTYYDPRKEYAGPSDGSFGARVVTEAAAAFGGKATLPELEESKEEVIY